MQTLNRRDFLQGTASLAAALAGGALLGDTADAGQSQPEAPAAVNNDRLNVAILGVNGRGRDHTRAFAGRHNCVVTHICDVDSSVVSAAMKTAEGQQNSRPTYVQDLHRIMDNKDIHIVTIATPNHWHSLAAIWAMQAGKHVYVEKPVSHNVVEGRRLVEIARRHNKICQAGMQIRSAAGSIAAIEFLKSGRLGQIKVARGLCYKRRASIGQVTADRPIPATIDYDLWCGPAAPSGSPRALALRLALDLGLRQRRSRQSGHSPDGRRSLGIGEERVTTLGRKRRRPIRLH